MGICEHTGNKIILSRASVYILCIKPDETKVIGCGGVSWIQRRQQAVLALGTELLIWKCTEDEGVFMGALLCLGGGEQRR